MDQPKGRMHSVYWRILFIYGRLGSTGENSPHSLIVELARAGAFSSSDILPIVTEFENPRHEEFKER